MTLGLPTSDPDLDSGPTSAMYMRGGVEATVTVPVISLDDYVDAVRRVGAAEALSVTASSAALCATGLAKEKK